MWPPYSALAWAQSDAGRQGRCRLVDAVCDMIESDATLQIITPEDEEGLEISATPALT